MGVEHCKAGYDWMRSEMAKRIHGDHLTLLVCDLATPAARCLDNASVIGSLSA